MAKSLSVIGLLFVAALSLAAPTPTQNIVQLAAGIPDLSTLVTALKAGKLATALSGAGPFTVFAPTNEAFAALPKARLASLLDPANIKILDAVLEYHVISGTAVRAEDLKASQYVTTLEGQEPLHITKVDGIVVVENAKVTMADVAATNGVVHVINAVLMEPDGCNSIVEASTAYGPGPLCVSRSGACAAIGYKPLACEEVGFTVCCQGDQSLGFNYSRSPRFQKTGTKCVAPANLSCYTNVIQVFQNLDDLSTLSTLFDDDDTPTDVTPLGLLLEGAGPFTFFAPANAAFTALPKATLASLLEPANIKELNSILKYHVISGAAVYAEDLKASQDVKTLEGQNLHITKVGATVTVQNAKVTIADISSPNGVVHIIDSLLMPPKAVTELTELADTGMTLEGAKCCTDCVAPKVKYFSVDVPHGFCGETCIRPGFFKIFHLFEKNLTKATDNTPCREQFTPTGGHYTNYTSTVSHGGFGLKVTLDLYGPVPAK